MRAENRGVCGGSDLESRTELSNGLDFEKHSFERSPEKAEIRATMSVWKAEIRTMSGPVLLMRHRMCSSQERLPACTSQYPMARIPTGRLAHCCVSPAFQVAAALRPGFLQ